MNDRDWQSFVDAVQDFIAALQGFTLFASAVVIIYALSQIWP